MTSTSLVLSAIVIGFSLIIAAAAFGSAIGDGIIGSRAVEAIARQPEARPNIFTFLILGVGILEAVPFIGIALALYLLFAIAPVPALIKTLVTGGH